MKKSDREIQRNHYMRKNITTIIFFFSIISLQECYSSDIFESTKAGVYFSYNTGNYKTDFIGLPGVPTCCPVFTGTNASGISAGLILGEQLSDNISIQIRFGYENISGRFIDNEYIRLNLNGTPVDGEFEHNFQAEFSNLKIGLLLDINPIDNLFFIFGGDLALSPKANYSQRETLIKPEDSGYFEDTKTRVRNVYSGEIPDLTKMGLDGIIGIRYQLPLDNLNRLYIAPEFSTSIGFSDAVNNLKWKINTLRFGLVLIGNI
jgi:hypothetical protein